MLWLVSVVLLAGCIGSPSQPDLDSEAIEIHTYGWSSDLPIAIDGGLRLEVQAPATWCEINATIAGRSTGPGVDALFMSIPAADQGIVWENVSWAWSSGGTNYARVGAHEANGWREALGGLGVALGGSGNMTRGDVIYMLAKDMTPYQGIYDDYPSLYFDARCDADGLNVSFARQALFLSDQDMEDGMVMTAGEGGVGVAVADQARVAGDFDAARVVTLAASAASNDVDGKVTFDTPSGESSWTIAPGIHYEPGRAGHYGAEVNRIAASLVGCSDPSGPCGTGLPWWGFIAGFEETDDPDAFFGLRDP